MRISTLFTVTDQPIFASAALLVLRIVTGLAFMLHGWRKIQNPFEWMGADSWAPAFLQGLAALSEFGGGLALIIGLLTPLASFGIACTMAVAFSIHAFVRGDPFVPSKSGPSSELAAIYLCLALVLIAIGPGRYSLDRLIFGQRSRGDVSQPTSL